MFDAIELLLSQFFLHIIYFCHSRMVAGIMIRYITVEIISKSLFQLLVVFDNHILYDSVLLLYFYSVFLVCFTFQLFILNSVYFISN